MLNNTKKKCQFQTINNERKHKTTLQRNVQTNQRQNKWVLVTLKSATTTWLTTTVFRRLKSHSITQTIKWFDLIRQTNDWTLLREQQNTSLEIHFRRVIFTRYYNLHQQRRDRSKRLQVSRNNVEVKFDWFSSQTTHKKQTRMTYLEYNSISTYFV